ncbi:MAG: glycoside hydrolase family 97 protein [Pirellulaceae bacterium]
MRCVDLPFALLWLGTLSSVPAYAEGPWSISSPSGNLSLVVVMKDSAGSDAGTTSLSYRVLGDNRELLPSAPLGITLTRLGQFTERLKFVGESTCAVDEQYAMPVGKRSRCVNKANELTLDFLNDSGGTMSLILRAYDDGVAYRYRIHGTGQDTVTHEASSFHIPAASQGWFARYTQPHYESYYDTHPKLAGIDYEVAVPALFRTPTGHWVYVTEAAVDGTYTGARLKFREAEGEVLTFYLPEQPSSTLPWITPWRVAIIGKQLGTLVESTLVLNLNPPSEIADTGWIKPGVDVIPWMTGPSTNNTSFERMKQFVDLASDMGWTWIEFDNALALGNQGADVPEKWMTIPWIPELVKYASSKGVNVYGWDHWQNLDTPEKREKILGYFVKHGFKGIKVDFLDSDSQERFTFREIIARECAERKLMLSYHGETMPRGQQRRWPHIATLEGVKGEEYYLFEYGPTPAYNVNLVFTRNIVGSMDNCPSGFELVGTPFCRRTTTNAHEMALAVLFESGWQSMSVSPESMKDNPAKNFLKGIPSAWDDIHFVDGLPGEFAVLARRRGQDWWLVGINAGTPRDVSIPLDFLATGTYKAKLYHDAPVSSTVGFDVCVQNCGGVNAVLCSIELWSTERPTTCLDYQKPKGMTDAPQGFYLIAVDDCGAEGRQPHLISGQNWRYSPTEIPFSVCDENDPARTMSFSGDAISYRFADLSRTARFKLRVMYLSHNENRAQSLFINGRELHDKLILPQQQIVCREFDVLGSEIKELPPEAVHTTIAVNDRVLDTAIPFKVSMPANGGFGLKLEGSAKVPLPR